MNVKIKKSFNFVFWWMDKVNKQLFIKQYPKYLKWLGIKIDTENIKDTWISPTVFFDSAQYDLIEIGEKVTISFDAVILVHDFSIKHAARTILPAPQVKHSLRRSVKVGNNVFIGAKTIILPGTIIEDNCIIGAGSVIKGLVPAGSICCGNPAKVIGTTKEFAKKNLLSYMENDNFAKTKG